MSQPLKHPTVEVVIAIHEEVLAAHGGTSGIRSRELLESAVAAPQATMMGSLLISDPIEIAAAYLFYLCGNHRFVDENKRMALATCLVFLSENDLLPEENLDADARKTLPLPVAECFLPRVEISATLRNLLS